MRLLSSRRASARQSFKASTASSLRGSVVVAVAVLTYGVTQQCFKLNVSAWVGSCRQQPSGSRSAQRGDSQLRGGIALAAEPSYDIQPKTWRLANDAIKTYEKSLRTVSQKANERRRELDDLYFSEDVTLEELYGPADPEAARAAAKAAEPPVDPDSEPFDWSGGLGKALQNDAPMERLFPDTGDRPPVLAGEYATGLSIRGRFSTPLQQELPTRMYPAQLTYGVDDPAVTADENALWKDAVQALSFTIDPMYAPAEEALALLRAAEERAEKRRAPFVDDFRKRVLTQMRYVKSSDYINDGMAGGLMDDAELDRRLTILQTDKRLERYLQLLEKCAMQAEEQQRQIQGWQKYEGEAVKGSPEKRKAGELVRGSYEKTRGLDTRIEAVIDAAEELPETWDAYDKFGEDLGNLNPFKFLR